MASFSEISVSLLCWMLQGAFLYGGIWLASKILLLRTAAAKVRVVKRNPEARLPTRGSQGAAGYDLYAVEPIALPARGSQKVATGIAMAIPPGYYGRVAPRSGLAAKFQIGVGGGVVDSDYRGEIQVILFNHGNATFNIEVGDRVAQIIFERILNPSLTLVDQLDQTDRDQQGFGSTGTK